MELAGSVAIFGDVRADKTLAVSQVSIFKGLAMVIYLLLANVRGYAPSLIFGKVLGVSVLCYVFLRYVFD